MFGHEPPYCRQGWHPWVVMTHAVLMRINSQGVHRP